MTTGSEFVNITSKKLLGFQDFKTRFFDYLNENIRDAVDRLFIQGSFTEKVPLSSPGINQVQIDLKPTEGDGVVHDGYGHIIDLEQIDRTAYFNNLTGTTYEVGAAYLGYPEEIRINPNTGKPEYDRYVDGVGVEAEPDSVTDNGTNITFRVDSLFEQGVAVANHAGRIVRVFKKQLADGAVSAAIAIETCTVFYGGGQNQITTSGLLGQTSVSTTASDYYVQLVGIIVLKNTATNRPTQSPDSVFFAGTVAGNTGATPTVFDITGQNRIDAQSASSMAFTPYTGASPISWALSSTDVQSALEEIVDDLTSTAGGANLIRISSAAFTQTNPSSSLSWGGLGTSGDELFTKLTDANRQIVRSRFGITHSSSQATMQADLQGVDTIITSWGIEKHFLKGAGAMSFSSSNMDKTKIPSIEGETPLKTKLNAPSGVSGFNWYGVFRDLQLGSTLYSILGDDGPFHAQNCLLAPNAFQHYGGGTATGGGAFGGNEASSMRSCHVPDVLSGSGTPLSNGTFQVITTSSGISVDYFSNCVFVNETNGSPVFKTQGSPYQNSYAVSRKKVFVNCAFIQKEGGQNALVVDGEDSHFIGCVIVIDAASSSNYTPAISITSGNRKVSFTDCYIYSDSGKLVSSAAISSRTLQRTFTRCHFSGVEADRDNSDQPCMIDTEGVDYIDCSFKINATFMRFTGATDHTIKIKKGTLYNCKFRKSTGTTDERTIHNYEWILFQDCKIRDLLIDFRDFYVDRDITGPDSDPSFVNFTDCEVDGFEYNFIPTSYTAGTISWSFFNLRGRTIIQNLLLYTDFDTEGSASPDPCVQLLDDNCEIRKAKFSYVTSARTPNPSTNSYIYVSARNCVLEDILLYGYNGQWAMRSMTENFASYSRWFIKASSGSDNLRVRRINTNKRSQGCINTKVVQFAGTTSSGNIVGGGVEDCDITFSYEGQFVDANTYCIGLQINKNRAYQLSTATDMGNDQWVDLNNATYSIVGDNIFLSEGAITPAVQNTGTGAVNHDNVLASGVSLP